jgi:hypothetical protein
MQHSYATGIACYTCHAADYNATTSPRHSTSGYGTNCATCHTSRTTWQGAVFSHPGFRLPHERATCNNCHPGGNTSPAACTCTACHRNESCR